MKHWWLRLTRYALPYWRGLLLTIGLTLLSVALDVLKPWPLKWIVDHVLTQQSVPGALSWLQRLAGASSPQGLLAWLAISTIGLFFASEALRIVQAYVSTGVSQRMTYHLGATLFDLLQRLSLRFHSQQRSGDLMRRVTTDSGCVKGLMLNVYLPVMTSLVSLVVMFSIMRQLDQNLSLIALLIAPLLVVLMRIFNQPMAESTYAHQQLEGEMMALSEQTLTALPIIQAFGRETYEDTRFHHLSHQTLQAYLRSIVTQLQFKIGVSSVTAVGTAGMMLLGGFQVAAGKLSLGSLLVFLSYLGSLYMPMETIAYLSSGFAAAAASAWRVFDILDLQEEVQNIPGAQPLPTDAKAVRGHIVLQGVTFGYEPAFPILHNVSLEARPGETVALVGATGAGKSTLVSLIPRFFDPWQGQVLFDGIDIRQLQLQSLRAHIALMLQDPFLLPLSIADNIAYGRPTASRAEVIAAARAANADAFIQQLPQGYDTLIGERGATLSGGQKQRLAIARALLKDARVLILDEPTSALDAQTESGLIEALERLKVGRTTLIIAHRLSTIRSADHIVVLDQGKVVETGSHEQLMASCGFYFRLNQLFEENTTHERKRIA
ncbi:ABC transporter ATP-binding protein [Leptolyngbya sp. FACHB-17]|uniref:ABC transporter ATP-binding protein n=1 Tax=unclassified Leptolyngbya TaxID=2650499 RepID=UPI0016816B45|nr:ABC transporter ATP-binding protein [Leptolyngbya sp. FACHB-17]MBD2079357.1 ABC transporter ATP-binding protein [Leptolyngbya sp. FACHB-17]